MFVSTRFRAVSKNDVGERVVNSQCKKHQSKCTAASTEGAFNYKSVLFMKVSTPLPGSTAVLTSVVIHPVSEMQYRNKASNLYQCLSEFLCDKSGSDYLSALLQFRNAVAGIILRLCLGIT